MKGHVGCAVLLLTILMAPLVRAADPAMVLAPPQGPVQGGDTVIVDLYLHNNTDTAITRELPRSLPCRIVTGQSTLIVKADSADPEADLLLSIPGRGFAKRQYAVTLPVYATGAVRIILETIDTNPIIIQVEKAPSEAWEGQQVPLDEGPTMLQSFLEDLSVHEPMYFLLGVDPGLDQSKFQFSFKYRLFNSEGYLAEIAPWVTGFHLGYTQRSIWDLKGDSKPFDDTSYMPEAFYLLPKLDLNLARISAFGVQGGFQHESNGRAGTASRSTNYLYVKPILGVHLSGPFHMKIAPKIYTYVENEDENNGDLAEYRGYVDLEVGIMDPEGVALNSHLWWARKGASVQLDLTYPMTRLLGKSLNFYLQAQYFSGYAETLIHYNERHDAFRLGFSIVR
ncbi:phospholipase A [uncultured Desulfosarcina sp.]|uniref:phospholipase A n=1 Tax=uncultured Desulfosarcina sp. TaxID=218289 RepID=UPI0029C79E18|nr:phospholipase A [uncultured Desulfosarcina sp.]